MSSNDSNINPFKRSLAKRAYDLSTFYAQARANEPECIQNFLKDMTPIIEKSVIETARKGKMHDSFIFDYHKYPCLCIYNAPYTADSCEEDIQDKLKQAYGFSSVRIHRACDGDGMVLISWDKNQQTQRDSK